MTLRKVLILTMTLTMATTLWAKPPLRRGVEQVQKDDNYRNYRNVRNYRSLRSYRSLRNGTGIDINLPPRGLVILANFQDVHFTTPRQELVAMLKEPDYTRDYTYTYKDSTYVIHSKGCAEQFFKESSNGQYTPTFDVVGPVTVSQNMAYYGENYMGSDRYPYKMVREACVLVDDSVDFSIYDNDQDGDIDFVYVLYAGYGEADGGDANTIWPHNWDVSYYMTQYLDSVRLTEYACSNEISSWSQQHDGIGTFCHEFGHVLGLPDVYATNSSNHKTSGEWDVMDQGCYNNDGNTPPLYSAYERFVLGWLQPQLIVDSGRMSLNALESTNTAMLISLTDTHNGIGNDPNPTTFYLLENRQRTGWDTYLPGHGLMLTKISYSKSKWEGNTVNNTASDLCIDIIEADGIAPDYSAWRQDNGYFGKLGDLFPYGATSYTEIDNHPIRNIIEQDSVIYFDYRMNTPTAVQDVMTDEEKVCAVYSITGLRVSEENVSALPNGIYIIQTTKRTYKIQL